jgi:hypothetical protein
MVQAHIKGGRTVKFKSDIDIDVANREQALSFLEHTAASIIKEDKNTKHTTGVYFTDIPADPFTGRASLDYKTAEDLGYVKVDVLNVSLYQQVKNEEHLNKLMQQEPAWDRLYDPDFCARLIHIGAHYDTLIRMPEAVNSIARLAMFLAVIRPAKRHLIGRTWQEVAESVWEKPADDGYYFKKAHAISYAHLVAVNINLISEQE